MKSAKSAMQDIGLDWNPKKCSVVHIKRGVKVEDTESLAFDEASVIKCLEEEAQYKFLGVLESIRQEDQIAFKLAAEVYLNRMSIIWSSPLSDFNRIVYVASNQYALPALTYLMWRQHLPIMELQRIDREKRKIVVEQGEKHLLGSIALCHLARQCGGQGLCSVKAEYKAIKIKGALNLFKNEDPTMELVRQFEDRSVRLGHCSIVKEALKYGQELGIKLNLVHPNPTCCTEDGDEIPGTKTKQHLKRAQQEKLKKGMQSQSWQGKLIASRWSDSELSNGFFDWKSCPSHMIAGIYELYEQMLNKRIYQSKKRRTAREHDVQCRLCGKAQESVAHILAGCSALAQSKYLHRHTCVLKILFFEMLHDLELVDTVPPWYSPIEPKPVYKSADAQAFWDVPPYTDHVVLRANRIDARFVDCKRKIVTILEMSCPWVDNRAAKDQDKKYGPLRLELKQQLKGYRIDQHNIILDVLGGYSNGLERTVRVLVARKSKEVLIKMQKSMLASSLHIARHFKIMT